MFVIYTRVYFFIFVVLVSAKTSKLCIFIMVAFSNQICLRYGIQFNWNSNKTYRFNIIYMYLYTQCKCKAKKLLLCWCTMYFILATLVFTIFPIKKNQNTMILNTETASLTKYLNWYIWQYQLNIIVNFWYELAVATQHCVSSNNNNN